MKRWSVEEWKVHVSINCLNSYGMAIVAEALFIAEFGESDTSHIKGLSGYQHEAAVMLAKKIPLEIKERAAT